MKVLAIDQGTTATKSFTLDESGRFESVAAFEHKQIYPNTGWVEHDAEVDWHGAGNDGEEFDSGIA